MMEMAVASFAALLIAAGFAVLAISSCAADPALFSR
jgi:hypothetical protein